MLHEITSSIRESISSHFLPKTLSSSVPHSNDHPDHEDLTSIFLSQQESLDLEGNEMPNQIIIIIVNSAASTYQLQICQHYGFEVDSLYHPAPKVKSI
jgi:hypothetical protein